MPLKIIANGIPLPKGHGRLMILSEDAIKVPTEKQVKYAKYLAHRMCQDLPKEYTKQAYSDFISKWKPAVLAEDAGMNEPDAWRMQYM